MSTHVTANLIKKFLRTENHIYNNMTEQSAKELGIKKADFYEADDNDDNYLDIDEALDNDKVYEALAALYTQAQAEAKLENEESEDYKKQKAIQISGANNGAKA